MRCYFDYCIYNKNLICILDKVEINSIGQCEDCIIVSIPAEKLEKYKCNQLQKILNIQVDSDK